MSRSSFTAALALAAILGAAACAGQGPSSTIGRSAVSVAKESRAENRRYAIGAQYEQRLEEMISQEVSALGVKENVPMELNHQVLSNIDYFLNDGRGFITRSLSRGSKYLPMMKAIFRQKGLPEDLVYLALIESGFKNDAVSRASAVGPWQFIAATARSYGLTINEWVDERRDPVKSTFAAADYLSALHDIFSSWPLAIAAYNSGEGKIIKGMKNYGLSNFWDMSEEDLLAEETKLYVPRFLAAAFIAKDPAAYGLSIEAQAPDQWDEVAVPNPITLKRAAAMCGSTEARLAELNPQLRKKSTPPKENNFILRIPAGSTERFIKSYANSGEGQAQAAHQHEVKEGESLSSVAALYMLDPNELRRLNKLSSDSLRPGDKLILPPQAAIALIGPPEKKSRSTQSASRGGPRLAGLSHKVQAGDSLSTIAKRYGVSVASLQKANNIKGTTVRVGQILKIHSDLPLTESSDSASPLMVVESQPQSTPNVHVVASGENLGLIARRYKMSVRELVEINALDSLTIKPGQKLHLKRPQKDAARDRGPVTHTVKSGDTIGGLAVKYNSSSQAIRQANNLKDDKIRLGQKLIIPAPGQAAQAPAQSSPRRASVSHTVQSGDTLVLLSLKYKVSVQDIRTANNLKDDTIQLGQKLIIPAPGQAVQAPAQSSSRRGPVTHTVKSGDTIGGLAVQYNSSSQAIRQANNLKDDKIRLGQKLLIPAPGESAAQAPAQSSSRRGPVTHTVKSGDTLVLLSLKYKVSVQDIRAANNLKDDKIQLGQKLLIPAPGQAAAAATRSQQPAEHTVAAGETLYSLARRYNISIDELRRLNKLNPEATIKAGQTLKLR